MINWGIIGAGNIAHRFVQSLAHVECANLYAVSNRTIDKANIFKEQYNADVAYGSFDALLEDSNVDVVYIALPHLYHKEYIIKAIKKNIAVLCEKPFVLTSEDLKEIQLLANKHGVFVMEAMKTKHVPLYRKLKEIIELKTYGNVLSVETSLCHLMEDTGAYHFQPLHGGCLWDLGIYNTCYLVDFLSGDYEVVVDNKVILDSGVETYVQATLNYTNGTKGILETAFDRSKGSYAKIHLTEGIITIDLLHRPTSMTVVTKDKEILIEADYDVDDFYSQIAYVNDALVHKSIISDIVTLEDSYCAVKMIEAIKDKL